MSKISKYKKRQIRVRTKIQARNKSNRPKISVFRSNKNIYIQLINNNGDILGSFSSILIKKSKTKMISGMETARLVGEKFTAICLSKGVNKVVFDKSSYSYSGRIKNIADSCRRSGLQF